MTALAVVYGTRPEITKLSPLVQLGLRGDIELVTIATGQHVSPELVDCITSDLQLPPPDHCLAGRHEEPAVAVAHMIEQVSDVLADLPEHTVVVHGDTNSTLAGALAANKLGRRLVHVEAGLRSYDRRMPEEVNRVLVDHMADVLFSPTAIQTSILEQEGVASERIHEVGNTVADLVRAQRERMPCPDATARRHGLQPGRYAVLTLHRPENVDTPEVLASILTGVQQAAETADMDVLWPIHPRASRNLPAGLPERIHTTRPVGPLDMLALQQGSRVVLTDSGGLQEEAAILGVPCVTLRTSTERPETVERGANALAGVQAEGIEEAIGAMLDRPRDWEHPYGDGATAERIVDVLSQLA